MSVTEWLDTCVQGDEPPAEWMLVHDADCCSAEIPDEWFCTRLDGHDGQHVAQDVLGKCIVRWPATP